ncbi:MAG: DUF4105 domain-containing protein [Bacteroidales bacterium]|nr:DUF4105 domain-containing protein [Bacteroidales bacterium]MCD8394177.1 DUF4105 domain-containing protein [Bacteroidales bacterium]
MWRFIKFLLLLPLLAHAQEPPRVSLLIASPGVEIYELEGHVGLRIQQGVRDMTINWGVFDFNAPNFVYRFVKGETDYLCAAYPTQYFIMEYRAQGRGVTEIPLNLSPEQVDKLIALVTENLRPENATYRYNYVKDNCSTRPIKLIEQAVGSGIQWGATVPCDSIAWKSSFRSVMRHYHHDYPWYQFGIDLALGSGIDYPITTEELSFAPVLVPSLLETARYQNGQPVVVEPIKDLISPTEQSATHPTPWFITPMAAGCYLLALIIAFTIRDIRHRNVTRWLDSALFLVIGLAGCLITFLVFVSVHEATSPNYLLFWLNPLALIPAVLIWLKSCKNAVLCYHFLNFALVFIMCVAWPALGQGFNVAFIPFILADVTRSCSYIYITRCPRKRPIPKR